MNHALLIKRSRRTGFGERALLVLLLHELGQPHLVHDHVLAPHAGDGNFACGVQAAHGVGQSDLRTFFDGDNCRSRRAGPEILEPDYFHSTRPGWF